MRRAATGSPAQAGGGVSRRTLSNRSCPPPDSPPRRARRKGRLLVLSSPYGHDIFASAPSSMQQQQQPPPPPLPPGPPPSMQQQQPPLPPGPRPPNLRQDGTQQMTQQQPLGGFAAAGLPGLGSIGGGASGYNMWADHFSQLGQAAAKPQWATPDDVRRLSESPAGHFRRWPARRLTATRWSPTASGAETEACGGCGARRTNPRTAIWTITRGSRRTSTCS